jgi:uncharacterized membrane protein (DUF4010 family)
MDLLVVFQKLAIALGLGLLVGLQRERIQSQLAGIRTFALITVLGAVSALLELSFGGWIIAAGGVTVVALLVAGNLVQRQAKEADPGLTTEVAALVMYAVGAYLVVGHTAVAIALGGGVALILHFKAPMHEFVARIGETDIKAIMQFVLIALVILPILPNQTYGPYSALNPHEIWLMVVLIVGINLGGYVAYKLFGQSAGALLAGVLGGLISSTATTFTYARRALTASSNIGVAALVIVIASTIALARVVVEIAVVAPQMFWQLALPLGVMLLWMVLISATMYFFGRGEKEEVPSQANPAELKAALVFGALYAIVVLTIAAAQDYFGARGLYWVAALSGLYDLDAITLSTARFVDGEQLEPALGWRLILTASLSNLVTKAGIATVLGRRRLLRWIAVPYAAAILGGLTLLLLWPKV